MLRHSIRTVLALVLGLTATTAVGAQEISAARAAAIRQGVQATLDAFCKLSAAGQWDAVMRLYADDPHFVWVTNGAIVSRSLDEIRKHFTGTPAGSRVETTYQDTEITPLAPGVATVLTRFETRITDAQGGGFHFGGLLTMTLVERGDGWKILDGHASSPGRREP
jgi:ketosteroid isomerase-like protein